MSNYLESVVKQFEYYKSLGEKTMLQLEDENLFWQANESSNSIAIIVNHLSGNMLSRWTDFLTTDGEKEWRNRDDEFEDIIKNKKDLMEKWERGWACLFYALSELKTDDDLQKIIYIRNEGHTVLEAINRQLAHYPYHIGQIVYIGKLIKSTNWLTLSIPKNKSKEYNSAKFSEAKKM